MTETPPPPTPQDVSRPRRASAPIARTSTDQVLGGVAGAIAARLDVEPVVVRVVLVVLAIAAGGVTIPAYLLAWVLIARDDDPAPRVYEHVAIRDGGILMWIATTVLAVGVLDGLGSPFDSVGDGFPLLPLALIGIGVALWTRGDRGGADSGGTWPLRTPPPPPSATRTTDDLAATSAPPTGATPMQTTTEIPPTPGPADGGGWPPTGPDRANLSARPPSPRTPPAPRERSVLGPITIALALIAAGVAAALDAAPDVALDLGFTGVTAVALLTMGLGLLVGSVWGRARWLLVVALLVMPFVGIGLLVQEADENVGVDLDVGSGLGERAIRLVGPEPLPSELDLLAGSIEVDLDEWRPDDDELAALDGDGADLAIGVGAGEVVLRMPSDVAWRVRTQIGLGEYTVHGDEIIIDRSVERQLDLGGDGVEDGDGTTGRFVREGGPSDGPVLDITADVALGQVTIIETAPASDDGSTEAPDVAPGPRGEALDEPRRDAGTDGDQAAPTTSTGPVIITKEQS